ncbi:hypothetical protein ACFQ0G_09580 [Streptomyces chiangmaiensis]
MLVQDAGEVDLPLLVDRQLLTLLRLVEAYGGVVLVLARRGHPRAPIRRKLHLLGGHAGGRQAHQPHGKRERHENRCRS